MTVRTSLSPVRLLFQRLHQRQFVAAVSSLPSPPPQWSSGSQLPWQRQRQSPQPVTSPDHIIATSFIRPHCYRVNFALRQQSQKLLTRFASMFCRLTAKFSWWKFNFEPFYNFFSNLSIIYLIICLIHAMHTKYSNKNMSWREFTLHRTMTTRMPYIIHWNKM